MKRSRHLRNEGGDFHCILIGEGEGRARIESQIRELQLDDSVVLMGRRSRLEVRDTLARADIVVQPSVRVASGQMEGIPVALMEALAMQRPVVATDISGVSELVQHEVTGLLVPERNAAALTTAIRRLREDTVLGARLGQAGARLVASEYDLHRNVKRLHRLLATSSLGEGAPDNDHALERRLP